ncbi:unnamed protein product [Clavelina lepadiformis]|uniref:CRAL-TRIO domain-containing protein n=1 Tax=Clavelina lepadiformis TaxID=159417 RepID=A0ABP0GFL9_CLALP
MAQRYQCKLSPKTLEKANKELNEPEDNDDRLKAIDDLKKAFQEQNPDMKLARDDDEFLLRFLRARKFNQERALAMITNYHKKTADWPEVFDKVKNPALISDTLDLGVVLPLKGKAKDGSTIVVGRPGIGGTYNLTDLYASIFLTMEKMVEDEETQVYGVTVIQDLAYLGMDYVKQINPSISRRFVGIVQDSLPLRVKSLNATNEPKIFDIVFAMAQPFMKEKIKKRYRLLGQDFTMLYEIIDKSVLPPMFAGSGPPLDPEEWKQKLFKEESIL